MNTGIFRSWNDHFLKISSMNIFYKVSILLFLLSGITHCLLTFKLFEKPGAEALWFFSGGLGLIICAFLNYIHSSLNSQSAAILTIISNILVCLFLFFLVKQMPRFHIKLVTGISLILTVLSVYFFSRQYPKTKRF